QSTGFTTVYNVASYSPPTGWQTYTLSTPITWNGTDGIVIYVRMDQTQPSYSTSGGTHQYTTVSGRMLTYYNDIVATSGGVVGRYSRTYLPNCKFKVESGCMSQRIPVTATIHPFPTVDGIADANGCAGQSTNAIQVTGPVPGTNFNWTNSNTAIGLQASGSGNIPGFVAQNPGANPVSSTITISPSTANCLGTPLTFDYTINATPDITGVYAPQTLCAGQATNAVAFSGNYTGTV